MENKINIAEILKDCPSGMELGCTMFENLEFDHIDKDNKLYPIRCRVKTEWGSYNFYTFTEYGCYGSEKYSKCIIFPKGKTTWEGFVPPCKFKDGDIVVTQTFHNFIFYSIYQGVEDREALTYVDYYLDGNKLMFNTTFHSLYFTDEIVEQRLATEEEKAQLFQAIKDNGYHWNPETKTLEKLPKFKVGDRIILKDNPHNIPSIRIKAVTKSQYILENEGFFYIDSTDEKYVLEDKFDITTLKPFDKVLTRANDDDSWVCNLYSHRIKDYYVILNAELAPQCIPYEGNKHLLNTNNNCDEYYKTW